VDGTPPITLDLLFDAAQNPTDLVKGLDLGKSMCGAVFDNSREQGLMWRQH